MVTRLALNLRLTYKAFTKSEKLWTETQIWKKNRVIDWSVNKALKDEYIFKMTISLLLFSLHIYNDILHIKTSSHHNISI